MAQDKITVFKIKNRSGYAAICNEHLTEGKSEEEAIDRMTKALKRTAASQNPLLSVILYSSSREDYENPNSFYFNSFFSQFIGPNASLCPG